jgi:2Fe-2S ferredoxin
MAVVRVEPVGIELRVARNETLFDAAWRAGYRWPTICFGQAQCTACHVTLLAGGEHASPVAPPEQAALARLCRRLRRDDDTVLRLACQLRVSGDATVEQLEFHGERSD